jgi:hypothetical protein
VQEDVSHSQRAQTQSRAARKPPPTNLNERLGLSLRAFAEANGKSATWAYRLMYAGKIRVISGCGQLLIPQSEIHRFLARAAEYNPQNKAGTRQDENGG